MATHKIQRSKSIANASHAWSHIRDFGSSWHPDIASNKINIDFSGAVVRVFKDAEGSTYREKLTYLSDTDRRLRYALIEGIDGIEHYRGEVCTTSDNVSWCATFEADSAMGKAVKKGTISIFDNGLDWLATNASTDTSTGISTDKVSTPVKSSHKSSFRKIKINAATPLSMLTTIQQGAACGQLVLFLHGIGGNATNWKSQLETLGRNHPVAALDFRGYGASKLGEKPSRIDDYCDDILSVMKHFGASRLILVGLSMGSWIATSFAMKHPQLLSGLVLAGGCTGMSEADSDERAQFLESRAVPLSQGKTPAEFADNVVQMIAGPTATAAQRSELHASMSAIASETYLDALTCFCNPVERFDFARITCPVLLMTGEHDRLAPPTEIREISLRIFEDITTAGRLPDIRFEVIVDAGHLCNLEKPELFNHQLEQFLERIIAVATTQSPNRETKKQLKSQRILDAALKEFCELGFDGASMVSIAKRAGVSKPTLYQYFGDKDGLFAAVLQVGCDHIITPLSTPNGSLVDRLWNFSWTYAEFVLRPDMLSLARLVLGEASRRPDVAGMYHDAGPGKAFQGLIVFIQECVAANQLDVDDVEHAAQDLWSLILSGPRDHHLHFIHEQPNADHLLRSIGHGLQVFLTVYSTNRVSDLKALNVKIAAMDSAPI